jgi:hypothetical protein
MSRLQGNIVILLLLIGMGAPIFSALRPNPRWEYRIESPSDTSFESTMRMLGDEGWELVFARRAQNHISEKMEYEMIFKRQR